MKEPNKFWNKQNKYRYKDYASFMKQEFGGKVQKISIDAGFTCPNIDGTVAKGGCTFCNNRSFVPTSTKPPTITEQLNEGIARFERKYDDLSYLAYFQSYSNTYDSLSALKARYEQAIDHPKVIGLVIGTRPDCVNEEILDYFQELAKDYKVYIEYGVESCNDKTLDYINRGHDFQCSIDAIKDTAARGLHTCAHFILGLPYDSPDFWYKSLKTINQLPLDSLKFHQLQIIKGTAMQKQFRAEPELYTAFSDADAYVDFVVSMVERLNPNFVIERFSSSSPLKLLISPKWGLKPFEITERVRKRMIELDTWQGKYV